MGADDAGQRIAVDDASASMPSSGRLANSSSQPLAPRRKLKNAR
jgi:hypothetical protein